MWRWCGANNWNWGWSGRWRWWNGGGGDSSAFHSYSADDSCRRARSWRVESNCRCIESVDASPATIQLSVVIWRSGIWWSGFQVAYTSLHLPLKGCVCEGVQHRTMVLHLPLKGCVAAMLQDGAIQRSPRKIGPFWCKTLQYTMYEYSTVHHVIFLKFSTLHHVWVDGVSHKSSWVFFHPGRWPFEVGSVSLTVHSTLFGMLSEWILLHYSCCCLLELGSMINMRLGSFHVSLVGVCCRFDWLNDYCTGLINA